MEKRTPATTTRRTVMDFIPRNLTAWVTVLTCLSISGIDGPPAVEAFSVQPSSFARRMDTGSANTQQKRCSSWTLPTPTPLRQSSLLYAAPPGGRNKRNSDDDEDPDERELVPVRRRKGGGAKYYDQDDDQDEAYDQADDKGSYYYDDQEDDEMEDDVDWEEDDEEDEDDGEGEVNYDYLFENTVIPNPLLDSMDPDGAADRFPELARDPRFWFDMALFVAFLNFLSFAGPRDPFPDIPFF
jgi:hypothetical protein